MGVVFLPSVCDGFCVSVFSLGQGSRRFCHELYGQSTVMFCRSGRDACFWKLFVFFVPTMFSGILGSFVEEFNSCVCFPFWSARKHTCGVCVVERIVARSVSSPEFFLLSASVCVAPFFSNPCLQGWATICSFHVHGSTRFVSSSLSYVAVSRSREKKQLGQAFA